MPAAAVMVMRDRVMAVESRLLDSSAGPREDSKDAQERGRTNVDVLLPTLGATRRLDEELC